MIKNDKPIIWQIFWGDVYLQNNTLYVRTLQDYLCEQ